MATTSSPRALYRSRQVLHALWPRLAAEDLAFALQIMTPPEERLFNAMERRDQRHALEVMRRLRAGIEERDVLVAALLHDCGKGGVPVWLRIMNVAAPKLVQLAGRKGATGWRGAAYRLEHHVQLSTRLCEDAGCGGLTVRLVGGTATPEEAWKAELLYAADDAS